MATKTLNYTLDQWEWQGTTQSIEIDTDDIEGMNAKELDTFISDLVWQDAQDKLHFVYDVSELLENDGEDEEE